MSATLTDIKSKYKVEFGKDVYPIFKEAIHEPFAENDTGYGYKAVVIRDDQELFQCSECGEFVENLSIHVHKHNMKADDYKRKFGFGKRTALCSEAISNKFRINAKKNPNNIKALMY